jgi:hypothetical protein
MHADWLASRAARRVRGGHCIRPSGDGREKHAAKSVGHEGLCVGHRRDYCVSDRHCARVDHGDVDAPDDGTTEGQWGKSGNRLYKGSGAGVFTDMTSAAGVRDGDWGWGASFADFDNDGWLDLVQVNGWPRGSPQFRGTPARLFLGGPSGTFHESAAPLGIDDRVGGCGVVIFDYDGDGDLDVFVANNNGPNHLWRNDGGRAAGHFMAIRVEGDSPNRNAIGANVFLTAGGRTQIRTVRAGSNYASQDPIELHFGLGNPGRIDRLRVAWPDGREAVIEDVAPDRLVVVRPKATSTAAGGCSG